MEWSEDVALVLVQWAFNEQIFCDIVSYQKFTTYASRGRDNDGPCSRGYVRKRGSCWRNDVVACLCSKPQKLPVATSTDAERSDGSYSIKLADVDVSDDVTDDGVEVIRQLVRLTRSVQLGFGFSAAGERPTTIRSVIKGTPIATTTPNFWTRRRSQNATLVVVVVVVISSLKILKAFILSSGPQRNFAYTFVLTLPTDLPSQIFHLFPN